MAATSAGLLVYRRAESGLEVLLGHPGGPFWAKRDAGAWSIPKGEHDIDEHPRDAARREFQEELGLAAPDSPMIDLGTVRLKSGKLIRGFALEGDLDPTAISPGEFEVEWPPRSAELRRFPEVDRVEWFSLDEARNRLNPAQVVFLDRLGDALPTIGAAAPAADPPGN